MITETESPSKALTADIESFSYVEAVAFLPRARLVNCCAVVVVGATVVVAPLIIAGNASISNNE